MREPPSIASLLARCVALLDGEIRLLESRSMDGAIPLAKLQQDTLVEYSKTLVMLQKAQTKVDAPEEKAEIEKAILAEAKKIRAANRTPLNKKVGDEPAAKPPPKEAPGGRP